MTKEFESSLKRGSDGQASPEKLIDELLRAESPLAYLKGICQEIPLSLPHMEVHRLKQLGENEKLIYFCLPTLATILEKHLGFGVTERSLFGKGFFTLQEAIKSWDPEKESKSGKPCYLKWHIHRKIRLSLQRYIAKKNGLTNNHDFPLVSLYWRCWRDFVEENGETPNFEEIESLVERENKDNLALHYGSGNTKVSKIAIIYSANHPEELALAEQIPLSPSLERLVYSGDIITQLQNLILLLPPIEVSVLVARFGLKGGRQKTIKEIASLFNLSPKEVRRINTNALRRIRLPRFKNLIKTYLDK